MGKIKYTHATVVHGSTDQRVSCQNATISIEIIMKYYFRSIPDPVILKLLEDFTLHYGTGELKKVEFKSRPESKGQVKIIVQHDDKVVKIGRPDRTHGVITLTIQTTNGGDYEQVYGTWTVHVLDLNYNRLVSTRCTVSKPARQPGPCGH